MSETEPGSWLKYVPMLGFGIGSATILVIYQVWSIWTILVGYGIILGWAYLSSWGPHGFSWGGAIVMLSGVAWAAFYGSLQFAVTCGLLAGLFLVHAFVRTSWKVQRDEMKMWAAELKMPRTPTENLRLVLMVGLGAAAVFMLFFL